MEELERTSGIYLGRPVAMNVTHLRLMNRLLLPFWKQNVTTLPESKIAAGFSQQGCRTIFRVRRTMADHFGLIRMETAPAARSRFS